MQVSPALRRLGAAYCWIVVAAALVPFAAVVVISFLKFSGPVLHAGFSVDNFAQLFQRSYRPLTNTLLLASLAAFGATLIGVPIGYVVVRHRSRLSALIDIVATSPVRRRRHRARHRPGDGLFERLPDPHRHLADHGARLHGAQAAVLGALGERDPAPDRSEPRGGLDQSRRAAGADLPAHHRAADARRHRRRLRAHLRDGRLGALAPRSCSTAAPGPP